MEEKPWVCSFCVPKDLFMQCKWAQSVCSEEDRHWLTTNSHSICFPSLPSVSPDTPMCDLLETAASPWGKAHTFVQLPWFSGICRHGLAQKKCENHWVFLQGNAPWKGKPDECRKPGHSFWTNPYESARAGCDGCTERHPLSETCGGDAYKKWRHFILNILGVL